MSRRHLWEDAFIIAASVALAWAIVHFGAVHAVLDYVGDGVYAAAFLAGMFFTSLITTAPAIAVLGELSLVGNLVLVSVVGGLGAVVGDYLIFLFIRDRVGEDIAYLLKRTGTPPFFKLFHRKTFRRLLPFFGGLIIASPLPDELGLTLMGLSKMRTRNFILVSFCFNTLGIFLIGLAARSLAG